MKKLFILLTLILSLYANDTKEILFLLKNLQKIQYNYKPVNSLYNKQNKKIKYFFNNKKVKKIQIKYVLEVIFNNKVKINGRWYKNGERIDNYRVVVVDNNVFLRNKHKLISLKFQPKVLK